MTIRTIARVGATGVLLALSACGIQGPTPDEGVPSAGFIYLTAEPATASSEVQIQLLDADDVVTERLTFQLGERIVAQLGVLPGRYSLTTAQGACLVDLAIPGATETDVRLTQVVDGTCTMTIEGQHPPGEGGHSLFGSMTVTLAAPYPSRDVVVALRSLDTPPNPVPAPVTPDETGRFFIDSLVPGRYDVQVIRDGGVVATQGVQIGTGAESEVSVEIDVGSPPAD